MSASLDERAMGLVSGVVDTALRKPLDFRREPRGEVGNLDAGRGFASMNDMILVLDERPLEGLLRSVALKVPPILSRRIEQRPGPLGDDIAVLELDVRRLDRKRAPVLVHHEFLDPPRAK